MRPQTSETNGGMGRSRFRIDVPDSMICRTLHGEAIVTWVRGE